MTNFSPLRRLRPNSSLRQRCVTQGVKHSELEGIVEVHLMPSDRDARGHTNNLASKNSGPGGSHNFDHDGQSGRLLAFA
jgi:hypothetical protein